MTTALNWDSLMREARGYLGLEDDEPVPRDELVATAEANGYKKREIREALRDTAALEAADGDVEYVVESEDPPETPKPDESDAVEPDISTATPGLEAVEPAEDGDLEERAHAAFADAIKFYHNQIDTELPVEYADTARDYYENVRGWSADTVEEKLLGYAPGDCRDELIAHLHRRGHDRDAIQACGLFYEDDLYPHFNGRFVLPYFDESGDPTYAISRSIDEDDGGHPDDHHGDQKYTKAIKGQDYSVIDEPIYGTDTLDENTDRLLVAGGIADAITLHEAGYACISPVTTVRFKSKHEPVVVDLVERYDLDGVYMLNDAERPSTDKMEMEEGEEAETIGEALTIKQYGEGERGAFGNAEFLLDEGVDPYLVRLPGGDDDLRKLDPDDYVKEGWGSVDTLLGSARHAEYHRGYADWNSHRRERDVEEAIQTGDRKNSRSSGDGTELYDLEFTDVSGMSLGDRQNNPLGHHGGSEGYFVCAEKKGVVHGYDHKYNVAYNAVSFLLCDAGERRADDPNGRLSDREVFVAWKHAKANNHLPDDDPVPYRGLLGIAVDEGLLDRDDLVERDADTGDVVEAPDEYDGDTYEAFPPGAYAEALEHVRDEHGVDPGREVPAYDGGDSEEPEADGEEYRTDPRRLDATVDVRRAWDAAGRVEPGALDEPLPFDATDDGAAWLAHGERVDVVRAVGLAEGLVESPGEPFDDYPTAYNRAREAYGAPLPRYYTTADAIAEFDAVLDVIGEVSFWDLDADALESEITEAGDEVGGDAVRALNPSWRESESEGSVLVFDSGTVWDADTELALDALRFVALDAGLLDDPTDTWGDGDFSTAYRLARDEYAAPLPRWEPADDGDRDHTAQLPEAGELVDARPYDGVDTDALGEARGDVESLLRDAMTDTDAPTVVRALPATGKTTGAIKNAAGATDDDRAAIPATYLAPRKELQQQALQKADRWGADATVLPVFADQQVDGEVLEAAVSHVRKAGKNRLRDRWAILSTAADAVGEDAQDLDVFVEPEDDEDDVDLDRPTCETADGEHGDAWALAVHIARRLGYTPREIHTEARGLFGAPLPCMCDDHGVDVSHVEGEGCRYSLGWSDVSDPDDPADLLVGSYVHSHVESARTYYERANDGEITKRPRAVVLDEFVGEAFSREFGAEGLDFATWLASALRADVEDRRDMYEADLAGDSWVEAWLAGDGDTHAEVSGLAGTLARYGDLYDARAAAQRISEEAGRGVLDTFDLAEPLDRFLDGGDPRGVYRTLKSAADAADPERPGAGVARWVAEDVVEPLERATASGTDTPDLGAVDREALPIDGDLAGLVERAVEAVEADSDGAREAVRAATTALRGGRDGCRRLAAWADDGYAHPDAHHLLRGVVTPTDADSDDPGARRIDTDAWAFDPDATEGTVVDVVDTGDRARTLLDRNGHGAILHTPPAREAGNGDVAPLVGLDATGRRELWATALLEDVVVEDIHDTDAERAEFLEEALDLRVIRASDRPRPYEGDPNSKDTDGDVALLEAIAEEYAGIDAPRTREDRPTTVGKPAAVTTKGVRNLLEEDPRLDDVVGTWEHYGNHTGSNDLGDHRLAALLGSQHYGDHAIERFAALAGESVDTSREAGRGVDLSYGGIGDAYLAHMREDQTMQAILRFARGDSGATVVARTSALREDLPVVGRAQVVETWSDVAADVAAAYRRLGGRFTVADVLEEVEASKRHVRRVLGELADAGYVDLVDSGAGRANVYERASDPGAGEVALPDRDESVEPAGEAGRGSHTEYYTWNVRVSGVNEYDRGDRPGTSTRAAGAPPAPDSVDGVEPPT